MDECCKDSKNLVKEKTYLVCRICEKKHYVLIAEAGRIGSFQR